MHSGSKRTENHLNLIPFLLGQLVLLSIVLASEAASLLIIVVGLMSLSRESKDLLRSGEIKQLSSKIKKTLFKVISALIHKTILRKFRGVIHNHAEA